MGLAFTRTFRLARMSQIATPSSETGSTIVNRVARLRESDRSWRRADTHSPGWNSRGQLSQRLPREDRPGSEKLYVTTGDAYLKAPAQNISSLAGKCCGSTSTARFPSTTLSPGSPVWSLGHRNPQGIAWDPRSDIAYVTEQGDSVFDEVNVLERGANYGWPEVQSQAGDERYKDPALVFHMAPTGATFLADSSVHGMLMATLRGRLIRLDVDGNRVAVADDSVLIGYGRLRDVAPGPDGSVYVSTSNRDGRGQPRRGDDRILRCLPSRSAPRRSR